MVTEAARPLVPWSSLPCQLCLARDTQTAQGHHGRQLCSTQGDLAGLDSLVDGLDPPEAIAIWNSLTHGAQVGSQLLVFLCRQMPPGPHEH